MLPGGSEAVLFGVLKLHPAQLAPALLLATLGNTLGGLTTYWLGRLLPAGEAARRHAWVSRYGAPALLFSWLPVVGDALCAAAGWLRVNWLACAFWMAMGKFVRYLAVAYAALAA